MVRNLVVRQPQTLRVFEKHGIRTLASDFALPADAYPTSAAFCDGSQGMERDLHRHICLENNLLFARALATSEA